jgi:two-component system, OmpR family, response regulator
VGVEFCVSLDIPAGNINNHNCFNCLDTLMQKNIMIVDDDQHIREVLQFALEKAGFKVESAVNGKEALDKFASRAFDCVVLDIAMPEMDGLEVCRQIRKTSETPILFLSSRDEEIDRIIGFEIGGDDYVTKPFSPRELVARLQAILKRTSSKPQASVKTLQKGALKVDIESYTAYWYEKPVTLTATEFSLLAILLKHPDKVYNRDELMDGAYQDIIVSDRTIDSHIRRIRQKFADDNADNIIETMHGIGYKLGKCQ